MELNKNALSPYVRVAMHSVLKNGTVLVERAIYDHELIFVRRGECRIRINGRDYVCRKNNVILLRPGIPHSFHVENADFDQPHIHFDLVYGEKSEETPVSFKAQENMTEYERGLIQPDLLAESGIPFVFTPQSPKEFQEVFFRVIDLFQSRASQLLLKSEMLRLLDMITEEFSDPERGSPKCRPSVAATVKDYIDGNFLNEDDLDSLAALFHTNKFTLMRQFKNEYGMTVIRYRAEKRIAEARRLLSVTNMTVRMIAEHLGFSDVYVFSRAFKRSVGISPIYYRRKETL